MCQRVQDEARATELVDTTDVDKQAVRLVCVPANQIADSLGNTKMANMVALGAYIEAMGIIGIDTVEEALKEVIAPHYAHLIPKNAEALQAGAEHARKHPPHPVQ